MVSMPSSSCSTSPLAEADAEVPVATRHQHLLIWNRWLMLSKA
jgi:hypothetical protein